MKPIKTIKLFGIGRFLAWNLKILLPTLTIVMSVSISYIGLGYALKSHKMLGYMFIDNRIPFHTLGKNLYAKLYWDATLSQPEDSVRKEFVFPYIFFRISSWHEYAAKKGNKNAQFYVGTHASEVQEKIEWWNKAAEQGHIGAIDSLGVLYVRGADGLPPDTILAMEYFARASEQGDLFAMTKRGALLIARNDTTGLKWLREADSKGYVQATIELGKFYWRGTPHANIDKSLELFNRAAKSDLTGEAYYYLGMNKLNIHDDWKGYYRDSYYECIDSFLKSARMGYTPSKYKLGRLAVEYCGSWHSRLVYVLEYPPDEYAISSFDEFRRNNSKYKTTYSTYCGWAWIIIAAEEGDPDAINYINANNNNPILHDVLSCGRDSKIEFHSNRTDSPIKFKKV